MVRPPKLVDYLSVQADKPCSIFHIIQQSMLKSDRIHFNCDLNVLEHYMIYIYRSKIHFQASKN